MKVLKTPDYRLCAIIVLCLFSLSSRAQADIITDGNLSIRNILAQAELKTPPANRVMAIVHTAVYASVNSITQEYPPNFNLTADPGGSIEAAAASAIYTSLSKLVPRQRESIERAYSQQLEKLPQGNATQQGINAGSTAALAVLALRFNDGSNRLDAYRPHTSAGDYVPTVIPAVPHWPTRRPWLLTSAAQFRPGPPPALTSKTWARDFNEVKTIGAADSASRSQQQTDIAKFWEATLPPIYHGLVHSVAAQAERTPTQNARLFALITQATDDALIAVFEAKYHYGFWRPVTAIRNADIDDNPLTLRDANWLPFISTPMHPEYPCAHCVIAATVGSILKAEVGRSKMPLLATSSNTADGATRTWGSVDSFVQEVSNARIYDGVHYRTSTEVGTAMGTQIGENALKLFSRKME